MKLSQLLAAMTVMISQAPAADAVLSDNTGRRSHTVEIGDDDATSWHELARMDRRLLEIGHKIAIASAPLCPGKGTVGLSLASMGDLPADQLSGLSSAYGTLAGEIYITAIAGTGSAHDAQLTTGNSVISVNDYFLAGETIDKVWEHLSKIESGGIVELALEDGRVFLLPIQPACPLQFVVDTSPSFTASSNGTRIRVTSDLVAFTANDDELAAIVAHEAAHLILCHQKRTKGLKFRERSADRLSARLLHAAGFDHERAMQFWRRYGARRGITDFLDFGHGRASERIRRMNAEHDAISLTNPFEGIPLNEWSFCET